MVSFILITLLLKELIEKWGESNDKVNKSEIKPKQ